MFQPVVDFVRYIDDDLGAQRELVRRSRLAAARFFGRRGSAGPLVATFVVATVYAFAIVFLPGSATAHGSGLRKKVIAAAANAVLLGSFGLLVSVVFEYVAALLVYRRRQVHTQKKAALQIAAASFSRDDWLGLVPGLRVGAPMYACMFENPALAHHEATSSALDAHTIGAKP